MRHTVVTRIERLERRNTPPVALVIVRQIVRPDGAIAAPDCLQSRDGRAWRSAVNETPEDFQARVIEEARQGAQGRVVSLRPNFATEGD
jgi:hypothetical protein